MTAPALHPQPPAVSASADAVRRHARLVFLVATVGETAALAGWLYLWRDARPWLAALVLGAGFTVERGVVAWWMRTVHGPRVGATTSSLARVVPALALATLYEFGCWWMGYRVAVRWTPEIAAVLLFLAIHPLHAAEMAAVRRGPLVRYLVRPRTVLFSAVEAVGGAVWIGLVLAGLPWLGLLALFVGISLEHRVQGAELAREIA